MTAPLPSRRAVNRSDYWHGMAWHSIALAMPASSEVPSHTHIVGEVIMGNLSQLLPSPWLIRRVAQRAIWVITDPPPHFSSPGNRFDLGGAVELREGVGGENDDGAAKPWRKSAG